MQRAALSVAYDTAVSNVGVAPIPELKGTGAIHGTGVGWDGGSLFR